MSQVDGFLIHYFFCKFRPTVDLRLKISSELLMERRYTDCVRYLQPFCQSEHELMRGSSQFQVYSKLFNNLGLALYHTVEFNEATKSFNSAIFWDPTFAEPYYHKAVIDYRMGKINYLSYMYIFFSRLF